MDLRAQRVVGSHLGYVLSPREGDRNISEFFCAISLLVLSVDSVMQACAVAIDFKVQLTLTA